ncbi:MAG TPA: FAD-binding oxidoreductase [Patescibacteria group bacterium]|nr:FAD-binding oxidoreductase [Patescibacteria group bacterium]
MELFSEKLKQNGFSGDIDDSVMARDAFSHDASLFELMPALIVAPKSSKDVQIIVQTANDCRKQLPHLSLTARSGGTDMSGGAINESVIIDMAKYLNKLDSVTGGHAKAQPGMFYRDFEKQTLKHKALMPSFPASRELCTIGGMVANNSGGELSLRYGKTEKFINQLKVVLSDGQEYVIKPLKADELAKKKKQKDFEGQVYRELHELIDKHYDQIKAAKPNVSKNSTGYNLWNVWDRETGIFDLTQLFVGSQGTLGFVTEIDFKLVPVEPFSGVLVAFMKNIDNLGEVINAVVSHNPTSFESFDNYTLGLSIKFFPYFRKTLGWKGLIKLAFQLLPDALILMRGIPKMVLLIEFTGQTQAEVSQKIQDMHQDLKSYKLEALEEDETAAKAWKFRIMRRESFNLLRKKVKDKHTAPFIDDLVVPPEHLVDFLPRLRKIINKYKLLATVAGHMGDGNFHVIPLMKIEEAKERNKLRPAMQEVNSLVLHYKGSLSGEHNDGLIRGPWLEQMYGREIVKLFRQTKDIFDPNDILNPHKKVDASWSFTMKHIRSHF